MRRYPATLLAICLLPALLRAGDSIPDRIRNLPNPTKFLILGKSMFAEALAPLVAHKSGKRIPTAYVSLEDILAGGDNDDPLAVKKAIVYAYIHKGTRYVMLVGDAGKFPVRHRYVTEGTEYGRPPASTNDWWLTGGYLATDFYYVNLFHHNYAGGYYNMDDWDYNKNKRYDEYLWNWNNNPLQTPVAYNPDAVDGYPDIALGRVPAYTVAQARLFVEKVIAYEDGKMDKESRRGLEAVACGAYGGSDNLLDQILQYDNIQDKIGQRWIQRLAINFPQYNRKVQKGWKEGDFNAIRDGARHTWALVYLGHGFSAGWEIFDNGSKFEAKQVAEYTDSLSLPVIFSIGCETGEFKPSVPVGQYLNTDNQTVWYYQFSHDSIWESMPKDQKPNRNDPIPLSRLPTEIDKPGPYDLPDKPWRTFACPWLFQKDHGGGIAFFGETVVLPDKVGRDLIERVLSAYTHANTREPILLGDIWLQGQRAYWNDFKSDPDVFQNARIFLSIMHFFGDPTLILPNP
jgi:hypothetical protein